MEPLTSDDTHVFEMMHMYIIFCNRVSSMER